MGLIGKKGKTAGVPLLVRSAAAQAANFRFGESIRKIRVSAVILRARDARPYGVYAYPKHITAAAFSYLFLRLR